jgi:hypothetical protein
VIPYCNIVSSHSVHYYTLVIKFRSASLSINKNNHAEKSSLLWPQPSKTLKKKKRVESAGAELTTLSCLSMLFSSCEKDLRIYLVRLYIVHEIIRLYLKDEDYTLV